MKLKPKWPLRVEGRREGLRYAVFPAEPYYECSCGEYVKNLDSILDLLPPNAPIREPQWRFRHGDSPEAVYVLSGLGSFDRKHEVDMEQWTERVHEYEKRWHCHDQRRS